MQPCVEMGVYKKDGVGSGRPRPDRELVTGVEVASEQCTPNPCRAPSCACLLKVCSAPYGAPVLEGCCGCLAIADKSFVLPVGPRCGSTNGVGLRAGVFTSSNNLSTLSYSQFEDRNRFYVRIVLGSHYARGVRSVAFGGRV